MKERIFSLINLFYTSLGKELVFRDEPRFSPQGSGKISFLFQFVALGGVHFHTDLFCFDRDVLIEQPIKTPLPRCEKFPLPLELSVIKEPDEPFEQEIDEEQAWVPKKTQAPRDGASWFPQTMARPGGQSWVTQSAKQEIKQSTRPDAWKPPEEKKGPPVKKWDMKGYHSKVQTNTDSLIEDALKRLKEGK